MGVSIRPSTFTAGGLIDDLDVTVTKARWVRYDFEGKSADGEKLCLWMNLADADGNEHANYWSAGDLAYFVPSEDPKNSDNNGVTIVQVGEKTALNGGTNCAIFINSLVNCGFPEDSLDEGDAGSFEGLKMHVNRVDQPKRNNMPVRAGQKQGTPQVLVCTNIISLPGEETATTGKAAAKPGTATGKAAPPKVGAGKATPPARPASGAASQSKPATATATDGLDQDILAELGGEIIGLFANKDVTSMKKVDITKGLFSTIDKTNANRGKLMQAATKDSYLKQLEGFSFDGSELSQAE